jgi:peptidoglycan/xylan/chitin deacetylase (PgdA/CDA1 family)
MYLVKPNFLIRSIYSSLIWKVNTQEKIIYLTFDDGPIPEVTPWVLQQLKAYQAKASFFCIGNNVQKHPEIFEQIRKENHQIGHHTFHHLNGWKTKNDVYLKNVALGNEAAPSQLFRPPYGKLKRAQIKELCKSYKLIMWDVLSYDYDAKTTKESCWKNVKHATQNGSIVVFHDSMKAQENLFYTLPKTLEYFSTKGFRFESLNL